MRLKTSAPSFNVFDPDFRHLIALLNRVDDFLTFDHFAKDRVPVVEPRTGDVRNEELRTVRIRTGVRHRERAGAVVTKVGMEFVVELIARTAASGSSRIAALKRPSWALCRKTVPA